MGILKGSRLRYNLGDRYFWGHLEGTTKIDSMFSEKWIQFIGVVSKGDTLIQMMYGISSVVESNFNGYLLWTYLTAATLYLDGFSNPSFLI